MCDCHNHISSSYDSFNLIDNLVKILKDSSEERQERVLQVIKNRLEFHRTEKFLKENPDKNFFNFIKDDAGRLAIVLSNDPYSDFLPQFRFDQKLIKALIDGGATAIQDRYSEILDEHNLDEEDYVHWTRLFLGKVELEKKFYIALDIESGCEYIDYGGKLQYESTEVHIMNSFKGW